MKNEKVKVVFKPKLEAAFRFVPGYCDPGDGNFSIKLTKKFINSLISFAKSKNMEPVDGGYFVLQLEHKDLNEDIKNYALKKKVLINPKRADFIKHSPRTVYYGDHMFDLRNEEGNVIIEKREAFWRRHEKKYQKWLRSNPV